MSAPKILFMGTFGEDMPLNAERVQRVAHTAARMGYDAAKLEIAGIDVVVAAKFDAAEEAKRVSQEYGLSNTPTLPQREGLPETGVDRACPVA